MDYIGKVKWPLGKADRLTPVFAAVLAVAISNTLTVLEPAVLTGDSTLNVTSSSETEIGSRLIIKTRATTNGFDLTMGSGIDGPDIVGVAGKTKCQEFIFDGVNFIASGPAVQID